MDIYGRNEELKLLKRLALSRRFEFVLVMGRRRVGKTFLVDNAFNYRYTFAHTGVSPEELDASEESALSQQLSFFAQSLRKYGNRKAKKLHSWAEAFEMLEELLESKASAGKMVVFIDELPWLSTAKSQFLPAFSYFLNNYASKKRNLLLIVSGSSNSWMDEQFSKTYGGFYHRKTRVIKLSPLTLFESKQMLLDRGFSLSDYEMTKLYMVFGGVPYYLSLLDPDLTTGENIDALFFSQEGMLKNEFDDLFHSIFKNAAKAKEVVRLLASKRIGYTQEMISAKTGIQDGGGLSDVLAALHSSDIIMRYNSFLENKNVRYYRLVDPFCLFYLLMIEGRPTLDPTFFQDNQFSKSMEICGGFAFENLVFSHIEDIKEALGIKGITSDIAGVRIEDEVTGAQGQIDLLILRKDNIVDCCEIKFSGDDYTLSAEYREKLKGRERVLVSKLKKRSIVEHVLITTFGLKKNIHSSFFSKVITLHDFC